MRSRHTLAGRANRVFGRATIAHCAPHAQILRLLCLSLGSRRLHRVSPTFHPTFILRQPPSNSEMDRQPRPSYPSARHHHFASWLEKSHDGRLPTACMHPALERQRIWVSTYLHPRGYICPMNEADGGVGDGINCAAAETLPGKRKHIGKHESKIFL